MPKLKWESLTADTNNNARANEISGMSWEEFRDRAFDNGWNVASRLQRKNM